MKIILISGKAQHGKDTFANILAEQLTNCNQKVLICHYADLVKYIARTFFNWNGLKDDYGRTLLQHIGTENVRSVYPNFWVDFVMSILKVFKGTWDYVLIPDTRFPNEIDIPKEMFDTISIRVNRPNFISELNDEQLKHPSETALDNFKFDYYIENTGDMNKFTDTILNFVINELGKDMTNG